MRKIEERKVILEIENEKDRRKRKEGMYRT